MLFPIISSVVLGFVLISIAILFSRTKHVPSKSVVLQIHSLIDAIVEQSNLLELNIQILQENVTKLNDEVDQLKARNTMLAEQITEVRDAVRLSTVRI